MAAAACGRLEYEGFLNRPVPIALDGNVPVAPVRFAGASPISAVLDSGSPFTVVDLGGSGHRIKGELRLQDAKNRDLTRFIFKDIEVFDLSTQRVGVDPGVEVRAMIGFSLLRNFVVRLSYGSSTVTLKDQIPDTVEELASDCNVAQLVHPDPLAHPPRCIGTWRAVPHGNGLVEIGGDSLEVGGTRLVLPLCLHPDLFAPSTDQGPAKASGVPATAMVATGQGLSVMSRSLLERLRASAVPLVEEPGTVTLHFPYGTETASVVTIQRLAAVSDETIEMGPCAELARRRRLLLSGRDGIIELDRDHEGSSVALVQAPAAPLRFAVLDDTRPLIQSLRQELSPFVGDIDVVLGGSFLSFFDVTLDYPAERIILQCADGQASDTGACEVLPFCSHENAPRCDAR